MICSENKKVACCFSALLRIIEVLHRSVNTSDGWRLQRTKGDEREAVHCIATLGASCRQSCSTSRSTLKRKFEWSTNVQYVSIASYVYVSPPRTFAGPEVHDMCQMCSSNETILFPRARTSVPWWSTVQIPLLAKSVVSYQATSDIHTLILRSQIVLSFLRTQLLYKSVVSYDIPPFCLRLLIVLPFLYTQLLLYTQIYDTFK